MPKHEKEADPFPIEKRKYVPCKLCWDLVWDQHTIFMPNNRIRKLAAHKGEDLHLTGERTQVCTECLATLVQMSKAHSPDITGHVDSPKKPDCDPGPQRMP